MPDVYGIEFNANQSELVREIVRELLKDGNCAVYPVPHIKPHGELRRQGCSIRERAPRTASPAL